MRKLILFTILALLGAFPVAAQLGIVNNATPSSGFTTGQCVTIGSNSLITGATCGGAPSGSAGGDLTGTYPNPTLAASITSGAHGWNGNQTITMASAGAPSWLAAITGDTNARAVLGINAANAGHVAFGPGNATQDAFIVRTGVGSIGLGGSSSTLTVNPNQIVVAGGTVTANTSPAVSVTQTWNNAGVIFTGAILNITNTASNSSSRLLDLQVGSSTVFNINTGGTVDALSGDFRTASSFRGRNSGTKWYLDAANGEARLMNTTGANYLALKTDGTLVTTSGFSFTDGAAAQSGTLTNAPFAGNPTKWIPLNDNGVTRYIPTWSTP